MSITPWPWTAEKTKDHGTTVSSDAVDVGVAWCGTNMVAGPKGVYRITPEEAAANARLIAAAPDLLEALRAIKLCEFNSMSSRREMIRIADAAIAKAEGK